MSILYTLAAILAFVDYLNASPILCGKALGLAYENSLTDQEILSLNYLSSIPTYIYENHEINDISRSLVNRIARQEHVFKDDYNNKKHSKINFKKDTDVILFFHPEDIDSISKKGFLNQHSTGKSNGTYDLKRRRTAEDKFIGLRLGGSIKSSIVRPKSAFLNIRKNIVLAKQTHEVISQYGRIGAVMKQSVKNRSLWSSVDSLELGESNPNSNTWYKSLKIKLSEKNLIQYRGTFSREYIPNTSPTDKYYEALIYGKIDISNVEYFLVHDRYLAKNLEFLGLPIYQMERENVVNDRVTFFRGARLN